MSLNLFDTSIDVRRARRGVRSRWRAVTALTAAFALVFVLMLAASHHHHDSVETDSCTVCSVGLHQLSGVPGAMLAAPLLILLPYRLTTPAIYQCLYARVRALPPSCGPPAAS
jgi:hypothetical protein